MRQSAPRSDASSPRLYDPAWLPLRVAVLVGLGYYAGARIGLSLVPPASPAPMLWPTDGLLLAALVLVPRRHWWAVLAGAFAAHLLALLPANGPVALVPVRFAIDAGEAALAALFLQAVTDARGLRTLRAAIAFCAAALVAPLVDALLDAGLVRATVGSEAAFGAAGQARLFATMLATLIFAPVLLAWSAIDAARLRPGARPQLVEVAALLAGLFAATLVVFDVSRAPVAGPPWLLYLPLPFLIWAALRFGPALSSAATALVALLVVWGVTHGRGPFHAIGLLADPLPTQLFLISIAVPLLLLAAVIEERREAERRLRASEQLFATAFRRGPDAVAIEREDDGRIVEANDRWLQLMGYPPGTAPDAVAPFLVHLDEPGRRRIRALAGALPQSQDIEVQVSDRGGNSHAAMVAMATVEVAGVPCHIIILRDITQQRLAEREALEQRMQLTHVTRVASLSDFSSTIAHELNQPLTAILANAQAALRFLQHEPPNLGEIRAILDEIADADKRAGMLIHHLRLLMKKGDEEFVRLDLDHLVRDVLEFIRGEFLVRGVKLKTAYAGGLPPVLADRVQLQQLLINLVVNACDAMQDQRGPRTLSVATSVTVDGSAQVLVGDNGCGIAPEQLERVFEPFYTTKANGLGMGLAICRRIAQAHGGMLTAQSLPGEGTTFRLVLPAAGEAPAAAPASYLGSVSRPTTTAS